MDVSAHILDAVQTASDPLSRRTSTRPLHSSSSSTTRRHHSRPRYMRPLSAKSSMDDVSAAGASDSEQEPGYMTDLTAPSEGSREEWTSDDIEEMREREYPNLKGKTYLDHGGTTLTARSMIEDFAADLIANLYGNPHSASTPSEISGHRVDTIRERTLRFFNADPEHFDLVFVANATAAIKLVIECYKDYAASTNTPVWYGYHRDAHTSVVGVREMTKMHRCFNSDEEVDIWINSGGFGGPRARQLGLFAYPGQSNMTGRRLPANWPARIRQNFHKAPTYTLLDAAALACTAPLDLSDPATAPDFVSLSFYKIFGFPDLGALIVRKESAHVLQHRKFFGGGTVDMIITVGDSWHAKKATSIHDRLEDGTLPFHSIFALDHAMNAHERLYGPEPMKFISRHTAALGKQLYDSLSGLRHANGKSLARIYKDEEAVYGDSSTQGATIAFNVVRADGSLVGYEEVEQAADQRNIFVRSGSLCNPGGIATYLEWTPAEMRAAYAAGHRCSNPTQIMLGRPTGVVRVSLGAMSTSADVRALIRFLEDMYIDTTAPVVNQNPAARLQRHRSAGQLLSLSAAAGGSALPGPRTLHLPSTATPNHLPPTPVSPTSTSALSLKIAPPTLPFAPSDPNQRTPLSAPPTATSPPDNTLDGTDISTQNSATPQPSSSISSDATATAPPPSQDPAPARFDLAAEIIKNRKPWEEELRKGHWATTAASGLPRTGASADDSSVMSPSRSTNATPSLKARRFGRSMVNLLRTREKGAAGAGAAPMPGLPQQYASVEE